MRVWSLSFSFLEAPPPSPPARGQAFGGSLFGGQYWGALVPQGNLWLSPAKERLEHCAESSPRAFLGAGLSPPVFQGGSCLKA